MWRMLSHIRTQRTCRALPQGLFEGHTNSPCWEKNLVSLFAGSLCWRHDSLGLWVPYSHCCLATSATTLWPLTQSPSCLGVTFRLNFFVLSSCSVFSSKFVIVGSRKCNGGLRLVQSNWKKYMIHLGQEAAVFRFGCKPLGSETGMTPVTALRSPGHSGGWREMVSIEHLLCSILSILSHINPTRHILGREVLLPPIFFFWYGSRRERAQLRGLPSSVTSPAQWPQWSLCPGHGE